MLDDGKELVECARYNRRGAVSNMRLASKVKTWSGEKEITYPDTADAIFEPSAS